MQKQLLLNDQNYHLDHTDITQSYNISPVDIKFMCNMFNIPYFSVL